MSQATHLLPSPHGTARFPFGFRVNPLVFVQRYDRAPNLIQRCANMMFVSIKTNEADGAH